MSMYLSLLSHPRNLSTAGPYVQFYCHKIAISNLNMKIGIRTLKKHKIGLCNVGLAKLIQQLHFL